MKKQLIAGVVTVAMVLFLDALPAAAQGRPQSHPQGAAAAGSHEPMGMGSAMSGNGSMKMHNANSASSNSPTSVLSRNSTLDSKLTSNLASKGLIPQGSDLSTICGPFRNLGQCIAAIHVSHNLGISLVCLQSDMTGVAPPIPQGSTSSGCPDGTGSSKMSLGGAIHTLKPTMTSTEVKNASKTANHQSSSDLSKS
ncbi:MAG TPA: hypothetical protein VGU63_09415 [Candidatus Acidoferrales bacterium]|nr:hypothetical protein [Candidatus Acidoferrales bacterium]